jgi:hypothetical protein
MSPQPVGAQTATPFDISEKIYGVPMINATCISQHALSRRDDAATHHNFRG